jgi:hypothetical protein
MMTRVSALGNQQLAGKNGPTASQNRGVGVGFSASNLQGAHHFEKPALQFGNDYAEKRKAALAAQVAQSEPVAQTQQTQQTEEAAPPPPDIVSSESEIARREAEELTQKFQELLPLLKTRVLEPVGDVPAFTYGDLLVLLADPKHLSFKSGPSAIPSETEPKGFYFTQEYWIREGFPEEAIFDVHCAASYLKSDELLTIVRGDVQGLHSHDSVNRGYEVTELGHKIARKYQEAFPAP